MLTAQRPLRPAVLGCQLPSRTESHESLECLCFATIIIPVPRLVPCRWGPRARGLCSMQHGAARARRRQSPCLPLPCLGLLKAVGVPGEGRDSAAHVRGLMGFSRVAFTEANSGPSANHSSLVPASSVKCHLPPRHKTCLLPLRTHCPGRRAAAVEQGAGLGVRSGLLTGLCRGGRGTRRDGVRVHLCTCVRVCVRMCVHSRRCVCVHVQAEMHVCA